MNELKPWHLLIVAAVFVVLFGSKKLPDAARSLGKSLRIFKSEIKALREDDEEPKAIETTATPGPASAPQPMVPVVPTPAQQPAADPAERG